MSHFVTLVILPPDIRHEFVESNVETALEPYSVHLEVDAHETTCFCVGMKARVEVNAEIDKTFDIESMRKQFTTYPPEQQTDESWSELMEPVVSMRKRLLDRHPLINKAVPDCRECNGTGVYVSCANPYGKWDWWVIGGRWDGWIFGPEREAASRDKDGGFNFGDEHHTVYNNCRPVAEIPPNEPHYVPFAIVTPQGEWLERGEMGWWAMVSNEKDRDTWHETVKAVFNNYPAHLAVTVDCHI